MKHNNYRRVKKEMQHHKARERLGYPPHPARQQRPRDRTHRDTNLRNRA